MKKIKKTNKLIFGLIGLTSLITLPIIASACSTAAQPQVNVHYVESQSDNSLGKVKIRAVDESKSVHEIVFENQNQILDQKYYRSGNLVNIIEKDNKRFDADNNEIDADGYILKNNERELVWEQPQTQTNFLKNINIGILSGELVRLIGHKLKFENALANNFESNSSNIDKTQPYPNNLNINRDIFNDELIAKINKQANILNNVNIADSLYTYITSMTEELMKWVAQITFSKDLNLFNDINDQNESKDIAKEFLYALVNGVGAGRKTFKLALYNFSFDWEFVNSSFTQNVPKFGEKVSDEAILDPNKKNVLVKIKNIHLQYAWFDSSNKTTGSFMEINGNNKEEIEQSKQDALSVINKAMSIDDKKNYGSFKNSSDPKIENLFYDIPLKDLVINFAPSTIRSANVNDELTKKVRDEYKLKKNAELNEEELKQYTVYNEFYTGALAKITSFSIKGSELKEDIKKQHELEKTNYVEDTTIENDKFIEHNRGLNGVYPYAFVGNETEIKKEMFIRSRKFVESLKESVKQKDLNQKLQYSKLAIIALANSEIQKNNLSSYEFNKKNIANFVFDVNDIKAIEILSKSQKWNEKNSSK